MYYVRNTRRESAGKTTLLRIALVVTSGALNYLMANPTHLAGASSTTTSGTPDTSSSMLAPDCDATSQQCSNNSVCVACLAAPEDSATTTPSCEERYPDILLDGDLSEDDCGIKGATFCCRFKDNTNAELCMQNSASEALWRCIMEGNGCSLEDMPCYGSSAGSTSDGGAAVSDDALSSGDEDISPSPASSTSSVSAYSTREGATQSPASTTTSVDMSPAAGDDDNDDDDALPSTASDSSAATTSTGDGASSTPTPADPPTAALDTSANASVRAARPSSAVLAAGVMAAGLAVSSHAWYFDAALP